MALLFCISKAGGIVRVDIKVKVRKILLTFPNLGI
jgi:hypothetical protein